MPYIFASGTDMDRNIQYINIRAEVQLKNEYYKTKKGYQKLKEIEHDINNMLSKYFDDLGESEILSNHEHNTRNGNY